jgi:hypothetical protein
VPVLVIIEVPGGSSDLDKAMTEVWKLTSDPPVGNTLRLAGPMEGGWRSISLWDSAERFQEFLQERLRLTLDETGGEQPTFTFWEIEKVHRFD